MTVFDPNADRAERKAKNRKLTAQLLVETADTLTHRWFAEDDGNLTSPEIMTCELRCMLSAYLVATAGAHV